MASSSMSCTVLGPIKFYSSHQNHIGPAALCIAFQEDCFEAYGIPVSIPFLLSHAVFASMMLLLNG